MEPVRDVGEPYPISQIGSLEVESIESYVQPQVKEELPWNLQLVDFLGGRMKEIHPQRLT